MADTDAGQHSTDTTTSSSHAIKDPLTNFTKRYKWQQRILENIQDFLYVLDPDSRILYVSQSSLSVTGHHFTQLTGRFIRAFVHPNDITVFDKEMNDSITTGNLSRFFYRFRKLDGSWVVLESLGHAHCSKGYGSSSLLLSVIARPYVNKSTTLMDSFMEHKMENIRLTSRLRELQDEEQALLETRTLEENLVQALAQFGESNMTLTRRDIEEACTASFDNVPILEDPEIFRDSESRSHKQGQQAMAANTSFIGDIGIPVSLYSDSKSCNRNKRKKSETVMSYVCLDCNTSTSPEWRRGPEGPKTLCNACGLRWIKKQKKNHDGAVDAFPALTTDPCSQMVEKPNGAYTERS